MSKFLKSFVIEEEAFFFKNLANGANPDIWYSFIYCAKCDKMNCFRVEDFEYDQAQDAAKLTPATYQCTCGVKVCGDEIPSYKTVFDLEDKYVLKPGKVSYIKQVVNYEFNYKVEHFDENIVNEFITQYGVTFTNSGIFWTYNKIKNGKTIENKVFDVTFKDIKSVHLFLKEPEKVIHEWAPKYLNIDLTNYDNPTLQHLQQVLQAGISKNPLLADLKVLAYNSTVTYDENNLLQDNKGENENHQLYVDVNKAKTYNELINVIIARSEFRTKSVRKALYRLSHEQGLVSPMGVKLLSEVCVDVNALPKLIKRYGSVIAEVHNTIYAEFSEFLRSLAKDFYNLRGCTTHLQVIVTFLDTALVPVLGEPNKLLNKFNHKCGSSGVRDTIRQITELKRDSEVEFYQEVLKKYKPEMNLQDFHDLVSEVYNNYRTFIRMQPYKDHLVWSNLEGTYEDYRFETAKSSQDLVNWGKELSHCVASYSDYILEGRTNIFAIYNPEGKLLVNVEVRIDKEIEDPKTKEKVRTYYIYQARGKCNRSIQDIDDKMLHRAFMAWSSDLKLRIDSNIHIPQESLQIAV